MINNKALLIGACIALGALVVFVIAKGGLSKAAAAVGTAAVGAADGAAGGVVQGIGATIGVPMTDEQKCQAAMASGNYTDASFYCPAPTFLKFVASGGVPQ